MERLRLRICERRGWQRAQFDQLPADERDELLAHEYQRRMDLTGQINRAYERAKRTNDKGKTYTSTEVLNTFLLLALLETQ